MKIHILYLAFGSDHVSSGLSILESILTRSFKNFTSSTTVIDNSLDPTSPNQENEKFRVIAGDNSYNDFSGWEKGLGFLLKEEAVSDGDYVLFANDSFHRHVGQEYLRFFDENLILNEDLTNSAIGFLDDFPSEAIIMGNRYTSWIRSNFFLIPSKIVKDIQPLVFPLEEVEIFSPNKDVFWSETDLISLNFKSYISCWLFGELDSRFSEYQLRWKNCEKLTDVNKREFQKKAICILSEHYLTIKIRKAGCKILDLNKFPKLVDRHIAPYYEQLPQKR